MTIAADRGPCPDAKRVGLMKRFAHMFAIAPTASISIICGEASPGIEPSVACCYTQKTLSGRFFVKNKYLDGLLRTKFVELKLCGILDPEFEIKEKNWLRKQWEYITDNSYGKGSVQGLEYLTQLEKDVFKTAFEIDQNWLIELAADRQPFICQGQSLNLFILPTVSKKDLVSMHYKAWQLGLKGLYYARSRSIQQASNIAGELPQAREEPKVHLVEDIPTNENWGNIIEEDECLACQ